MQSTTTPHIDQPLWILTVAVLALVVFAGVMFLSSANDGGLSVTAHVSGARVTSVTVDGAKLGGAENLKVQLLDSQGAVLSEGCTTSSGTGKSFSNVWVDMVPDTTQSTVAKVNALGVVDCLESRSE